MKKSRAIYMLLCFTIINAIVCMVLYHMLDVRPRKQITQAVKWMYKEYISNDHQCFTEPNSGIIEVPVKNMNEKYYRNHLMCSVNEQSEWEADIIIEKEIDKWRISYPKYVYPVSGYLQLITVDKWNIKKLKVIIMPHSHMDPGWKSTLQSYFTTYGKNILNNIISMLSKNKSTKFIWSEMVFLSEWWNQASQNKKDDLKRLLDNKQLEITTGGWVMADEGTAHYTAMLDQLIEGHQWLQQNLGIQPTAGWSVDPFGHSPTMSYLLKHSGINGMVIQRIHYSIKKHLAEQRSLEFFWRQGWASTDSTDIFCHMIPFLSYAIQHSCGPDPYVCCQYDFFKKQCYHGSQKVDIQSVDDNNIDSLSRQLWEQFQKKAELYRTNVILVPHGDDVRYATSLEWHNQLHNLEKLMTYINSRPDFQTEVRFGTLSDYFNEVAISKTRFPTLSGDFFTYADRGEDYWSGYYTTRPHYKHIIRRVQDLLRSLEILFTYCFADAIRKTNQTVIDSFTDKIGDLSYIRQQVALFQHHDAITGTSTSKVMKDYGKRLHSGYQKGILLLEKILSYLAKDENEPDVDEKISMTFNWTQPHKFIDQKVINLSRPKYLFLYNSLNFERQSAVKLHINTLNVKVKSLTTADDIPHQISPVVENNIVKTGIFEISFIVELPGLSISKYLISALGGQTTGQPKEQYLSHIDIVTDQSNNLRFGKFPTDNYTLPMFTIGNEHLTATFYSCNGKLQYISRNNSTRYKSEVKLMTYGTGSWSNPFKDKSGAYLFLPDGNAKNFAESIKYLYIIKGQIYSSVVVVYSSITQIYTVYNMAGSDGMGVHIENLVNISNGTIWNNKELIMRIETDVKDSDNQLCVDLNGFQMHRKKTRKKIPLQGNFFPMTSMMSIENNVDRVTIVSSETHGVASLSPGWFEVVLDRRLIQDDWRGLSQGVTDNVLTKSHFVLLFETRNISTSQKQGIMCYPSPTAEVVSKLLEHHVISMTQFPITNAGWSVMKLSSVPQREIHLVNLRFLSIDNGCMEVLLIIHSTQLDCSFPIAEKDWKSQHSNHSMKISKLFENNVITSIKQTILTGVKVVRIVLPEEDIAVNVMEIKTYKVTVC
ncbi:alpha-mannosidase 2-like [Mytilus edulis]|uniref:alpha-mannosidase 2-like n=1 Tax=Mytilus edulis TaxID=6550 RepID=UPI0039EFA8AE